MSSKNNHVTRFGIFLLMSTMALIVQMAAQESIMLTSSDRFSSQINNPTKNDNNSLMSGTLNTGNYVLQVDHATQTILNELGRNTIPTPPIKITSSDIPDSGLASAYKTHQFKIESNNPSIKNPKWEFIMPLANGQTQSIFPTDNGFSCTIAPITNENVYPVLSMI